LELCLPFLFPARTRVTKYDQVFLPLVLFAGAMVLPPFFFFIFFIFSYRACFGSGCNSPVIETSPGMISSLGFLFFFPPCFFFFYVPVMVNGLHSSSWSGIAPPVSLFTGRTRFPLFFLVFFPQTLFFTPSNLMPSPMGPLPSVYVFSP